MPDTLDEIFRKEVNSVLGSRKKSWVNILNVPLPPEVLDWEISGKDLFRISGIPNDTEYFHELNGEIVWKIPSGKEVRKRKHDDQKGVYVKDAFGDYVYDKVTKPKDSEIICSYKNIKTPRRVESPSGVKSRYVPPAGYDYIEYFDDENGKRVFIYAVPKKYIYKINQAVLAISKAVSQRGGKKCYQGLLYHTWDYGGIYLYILPYTKPDKGNVDGVTRYLCTGYGKDLKDVYDTCFKDKVAKIQDYWIETNVIGNPRYYYVDGVNLIQEEEIEGLEVYEGISDTDVLNDALYNLSDDEEAYLDYDDIDF